MTITQIQKHCIALFALLLLCMPWDMKADKKAEKEAQKTAIVEAQAILKSDKATLPELINKLKDETALRAQQDVLEKQIKDFDAQRSKTKNDEMRSILKERIKFYESLIETIKKKIATIEKEEKKLEKEEIESEDERNEDSYENRVILLARIKDIQTLKELNAYSAEIKEKIERANRSLKKLEDKKNQFWYGQEKNRWYSQENDRMLTKIEFFNSLLEMIDLKIKYINKAIADEKGRLDADKTRLTDEVNALSSKDQAVAKITALNDEISTLTIQQFSLDLPDVNLITQERINLYISFFQRINKKIIDLDNAEEERIKAEKLAAEQAIKDAQTKAEKKDAKEEKARLDQEAQLLKEKAISDAQILLDSSKEMFAKILEALDNKEFINQKIKVLNAQINTLAFQKQETMYDEVKAILQEHITLCQATIEKMNQKIIELDQAEVIKKEAITNEQGLLDSDNATLFARIDLLTDKAALTVENNSLSNKINDFAAQQSITQYTEVKSILQQRIALYKSVVEKINQKITEIDQAEAKRAEEQAAADKLAAEQAAAKLAQEQAAAATEAEKQRIAAEQAAQELLAKEAADKERLAQEEQTRIAQEKAAAEAKAAEEKAAADKLAAEQAAAKLAQEQAAAATEAEKQRIAAEQAAQELLAKEAADKERLAQEEQTRIAQEKAAAEAKAAEEKAAADKLAAEQAADVNATPIATEVKSAPENTPILIAPAPAPEVPSTEVKPAEPVVDQSTSTEVKPSEVSAAPTVTEVKPADVVAPVPSTEVKTPDTSVTPVTNEVVNPTSIQTMAPISMPPVALSNASNTRLPTVNVTALQSRLKSLQAALSRTTNQAYKDRINSQITALEQQIANASVSAQTPVTSSTPVASEPSQTIVTPVSTSVIKPTSVTNVTALQSRLKSLQAALSRTTNQAYKDRINSQITALEQQIANASVSSQTPVTSSTPVASEPSQTVVTPASIPVSIKRPTTIRPTTTGPQRSAANIAALQKQRDALQKLMDSTPYQNYKTRYATKIADLERQIANLPAIAPSSIDIITPTTNNTTVDNNQIVKPTSTTDPINPQTIQQTTIIKPAATTNIASRPRGAMPRPATPTITPKPAVISRPPIATTPVVGGVRPGTTTPISKEAQNQKQLEMKKQLLERRKVSVETSIAYYQKQLETAQGSNATDKIQQFSTKIASLQKELSAIVTNINLLITQISASAAIAQPEQPIVPAVVTPAPPIDQSTVNPIAAPAIPADQPIIPTA